MTGTPLVTVRDISGMILAGGRGKRLGGVDKGFVRLLDRPLIRAFRQARLRVSRLPFPVTKAKY